MLVRVCLAVLLIISGDLKVRCAEQVSDETKIVKGDSTRLSQNDGLNVIRNLLSAGSLKKAETLIVIHLGRFPNDVDYLFLKAQLLLKKGLRKEAIETLSKAREISSGYEDVYLVEAGLLAADKKPENCHSLVSLFDEYRKKTTSTQLEKMEKIRFDNVNKVNEITAQTEYDELSNNRGTWRSYTLQYRKRFCTMDSIYAGVNSVERYGVEDKAVIVGGNLKLTGSNVEFEYRHGLDDKILPSNTVSGMLTIESGTPFNFLLLASARKYKDLDAESMGLGVDAYLGNYQLMAIHERTEYDSQQGEFSPSNTGRFHLAYYFMPRKYLRFSYVSGKELDNDGTDNPPYSKIRTILLTFSLPVTNRANFVFEAKRHYQTGYYQQNGLRVAYSYQY